MLYALGAPLPKYRIKAFNNAKDSSNRIHDDVYARRYGFRGGLVPGVSIYAYMSRSLVEFAGKDWLERGSTEVRFVHPLYEGEEVQVSGFLASVEKDGKLSIEYQASSPLGVTCGVGTAWLPPQPTLPEPTVKEYPAGLQQPGRDITLESLTVGEHLTPITSEFTWNVNWEYCQKTVRDHHPIYQQNAHPGWLLSQANSIFATNYDLPPWIHVSSRVQSYHALDEEGDVETRGRVRDKFERRGHHFVVLELALFREKRCLETICHTAIFRIAPRAA